MVSTAATPLSALEFYSGIGGLHLALQRSSVAASLLAAFDWDQSACRVYSLNFPNTPVIRLDICALSTSDLAHYQADLWLLSPCCQPYTRLNRSRKDDADPRARPFLHLVHKILPGLAAQGNLPRYVFIENVAGFELSNTRSGLLTRLKSLGYLVLEFLLTPLQFGIPNSRLRYYLLAKLPPLSFRLVDSSDLSEHKIWRHIPGCGIDMQQNSNPDVHEIRGYLQIDDGALVEYAVSHRTLQKWGRLFDVVLPSSRRSCCFTRGYTRLVEGTGSILQMNENVDTDQTFERFLQAEPHLNHSAVNLLDCLQLRYFTPNELLRLSGFQDCQNDSFKWPVDISTKTKYRLIGNSVNVNVVEHLINFFLQYDQIAP